MHSLTEHEQRESHLDISLKPKQNIAASLHHISTQINLVTSFQNLRILVTLERTGAVHVVSLEVVSSISIPLRRSMFSGHQKQLRMTGSI